MAFPRDGTAMSCHHRTMRVHIQNPAEPDPMDVSEAQWQAAAADEHSASFGRGPGAFAAGIAEAEALVVPVGVLARLLPLPPNRLRIISCLSAGVDRLAPFDWLPQDCALWNNRGAHSAKAGEYAAMALTMLAFGMPGLIAAQRAETWGAVHTPTLRGRRLLVVGTGVLGSAAARQGRALAMRVGGISRTGAPHPDFDDVAPTEHLDAALADAEFVLLACPLTDATRNLLSRARLRLLPPKAHVINVGRGALLDQDALCDLLDSGHLAGAVLDVTRPEPPPAGNRIWHAPNLILTPHVSADDPTCYNQLSLDIFVANLREAAAGRPAPNRVDMTHGY